MEFVYLKKEHINELLFFLNDNINEYFTPHPIDGLHISNIIDNKKKDYYIIVFNENKIIGYLLLRGYDEGYEIPSLGIILDKNYRGSGLSKLCMYYLEYITFLNCSDKIRLTVKKENKIAINLYQKLGYKLSELDENNLLGIKKIENYGGHNRWTNR
jgi:ribosomal-protein-alanine N-acetyltransferase